MKRYLFLFITLVILCSLTGSAFGETYYVATNGKNSNAGTMSQPWATLACANGRVSSGDTVYIRGGTYTGSGNREVMLSTSGVTYRAHPGEIPVFDGQNGLSVTWNGIIGLTGDRVVLDGITVQNSNGYGLEINGDHCTIRNCTVQDIGEQGIALCVLDGPQYTIYNATIEYCTITRTGLRWWNSGDCGVVACSGCNPRKGDWPCGIAIRNTQDSTIRGNHVYRNYGEGINVFWGSHGCIIENNVIHENTSAELNLDGSNNLIIRYNLIYGTTDRTYWRVQHNCSQNYPSDSLSITLESELGCHDMMDGKIYGNLIAFGGINLKSWRECGGNTFNNWEVYNNTFIEGYVANIAANHWRNLTFENNIVWQTTGAINSTSDITLSEIDYNLWSSDPGSGWRGAHDPAYAEPEMIKSSGWRSLCSGELDGSEFALQSNSPAIDAGANLGSQHQQIPELEVSDWTAGQIVPVDQNTQGSGWEIGADIYIESSPVPLAAPNGLRILPPH